MTPAQLYNDDTPRQRPRDGRRFTTEIRGDYVYVIRLPDRSSTGPSFSLCEEFKARRYAGVLNRANGYPMLIGGESEAQP